MSELLKKRNTIYGFCAIWIILFHTFRRIGMPYIPVLTNVIGIGNMAVDVFFFLSGLCLSLSVKKRNYLEHGWKEYYKRRFTRVLLPYFMICIPYYLWSAVFESEGSLVRKAMAYAANLSSASFWLRGTQTTWYVYGIVVFYLLFPLIYSIVQKKNAYKTLVLLLGFIAFAIIGYYVPLLRHSTIVWARLPIFAIGVVCGVHGRPDRTAKATKVAVCGVMVLLIGFLTSLSELSKTFTIPQVYRFLLYIPLTLSLLVLLSKWGCRNALMEWVGGLSLEVYIVHITLLHPIKYYGMMDAVGYWLYLLLPVISILIAWLIGKAEKKIVRRLSV